MNQHVAIDRAMEAAAEEIMSGEISPDAAPHNVVTLDPPTELERHAALHRRIIDQQTERIVEMRKAHKEIMTGLKEQRRQLREQFFVDMARMAESEAWNKAQTAKTIHTAERLAAASRAALREIDG